MTMTRMNRLFGVTMAEKGISQLVSVDLETAQKLHGGRLEAECADAAPRPIVARRTTSGLLANMGRDGLACLACPPLP